MYTTESEKSKYGRRYGCLVGNRFGRWVVTAGPVAGRLKHRKYWSCHCDCGTEAIVEQVVLVDGRSQSCGCLKRELAKQRLTQHGGTGERLHNIWMDMKRRCEKPGRRASKYYLGSGIKVCDEWQDYAKFREWAKNNGYKDDLSIERKDVSKNYEPSNCCWIPRNMQPYNRRDTVILTAFGETKSLHDWVNDTRCPMNKKAVAARLRLGWNAEDAISKPHMRAR